MTSTQTSIKWALCPRHNPDPLRRLTGLIAIDNKTLAFRDHTKKVGKVTIPCPGSGEIWTGDTHDHVS